MIHTIVNGYLNDRSPQDTEVTALLSTPFDKPEDGSLRGVMFDARIYAGVVALKVDEDNLLLSGIGMPDHANKEIPLTVYRLVREDEADSRYVLTSGSTVIEESEKLSFVGMEAEIQGNVAKLGQLVRSLSTADVKRVVEASRSGDVEISDVTGMAWIRKFA